MLVIALLFLAACHTAPKTPKDKAEALITAMFDAPTNHTYRYEAGIFGKLDSSYSSYHDDEQYKVFQDSVSYYLDQGTTAFGRVADIGYRTDATTDKIKKEKLWKQMLSASDTQRMYNDNADFYSKKLKFIRAHHKPFFNGWKMEHHFKANNNFGFQVDRQAVFYFDKSLTKVIKFEDAGKQ
ncbi:hypothetical protein CA265_08050 [Sphingobacteriaceae bacterium GW460-11-11-14-LB5]|nr:hypothetical protein CA265_08050 [Sphingobacteriaceae bacterium GW460-11-11-14-LB5]